MKREINMCKIGNEPIKENRSGTKDARAYRESREDNIITDPQGSWTGVPIDGYFEIPVQDVDDL